MQLMRTLAEENVFSFNGTKWVWTLPSTLQLPAGMSDLVGRRLNRLPPEAMRILVNAAAIGRVFTIDLLAEATGTIMDTVLDAVDAGLAASVLEPAREHDHDTYQFAHALLVDAVLSSVSPARQRITHERVGDLLAIRMPEAIDRIASLYARSGNAAKAYAWCMRAGACALALHALDVATDFLRLALGHATTNEERFAVHNDLAVAAELSGRWADVERSCDEILALPGVLESPVRALPLQQRRAQARLRMGTGVREMERECHELLAVAERLGAPAEIVRTRSLLVQVLQRLGRVDEAIQLAEESLRTAEASGDEALSGEAMHRLGHTLLGARPREAIAIMLRLFPRARARRDPLMEARAFLALGVARTRTRDDLAAVEAFRLALRVALEAQALEVAAAASMNLGVIEMRRGEFGAAHQAFQDALRLYTTLRHNTSRLAALYNLANLESERGDTDAAGPLYQETAALAEQVGADDIGVGALAGLGLVALRLHDIPGARNALVAAQRTLGERADWWFQGRERLESLFIRLAIHDDDRAFALARFRSALERLEALDIYSAAWLVGDCAAEVAVSEPEIWATVERFAENSVVQQFVPLAARFTALRDIAHRRGAGSQRVEPVATPTGESDGDE
jgi:tetratricopeptide (TPR) repeat protein